MATPFNINSTSPTQKPFRFFALPPEIRNMIYGLLVFDAKDDGMAVYRKTIIPTAPLRDAQVEDSMPLPEGRSSTDVYWTWFSFKRTFEPQVLLTNRQIKNEALPMFYSKIEIGYHITDINDLKLLGSSLLLSPLGNVKLCCLHLSLNALFSDLWVFRREGDLQELEKDLDTFFEGLRSISSLRELKLSYKFHLAYVHWEPARLLWLYEWLIIVLVKLNGIQGLTKFSAEADSLEMESMEESLVKRGL
ncbi:MAG: hypothetical protein M1812_001349 [Candelaria pacifica]|nr:MAG: hypothetical protein M1812_001349 [Candelaria pacifica]